METYKSNQNEALSSAEENTQLLFYDNFIYQKSQYNIEEIFFSKAIVLHQIRILKFDSNPHTKLKSMQSKTQQTPVYNFEIFARNLKKHSDKFEKVFESSVVNKENGEADSIFPFLSEFVTNHIVFRGTFEKITMCIYGIPLTGSENHLLLESAKSEVSLEKLQEANEEENKENVVQISKEDFDLMNQYPIESLFNSYFKYNNNEIFKRVYSLNKPNVNMIDKTKGGYFYFENEMAENCQYILEVYQRKNNFEMRNDNEVLIKHQKSFKNLFDIIKVLIKRNCAFLDDDSVFRTDNFEIFNKIPEETVDIVINSLKGNIYGYTEIKFGLKLLKIIANSESLVSKFVKNNGLDLLYQIIVIKEDPEKESSSLLKALSLECLYKLITFKIAFEKFIENKKNSSHYYMIKENSKDSTEMVVEKESSKDEKKDKKSKKEKKHKKKHHKKSRSRSRDRSRDRSRSDSESKEKKNDSSSERNKKLKKKHKNVSLKNGYQIISTLLINKKSTLLVNIIKHIIAKVNLILYLKNFNTIINKIHSDPDTIVSIDLEKVVEILNNIYYLLTKIETPYKKSEYASDNQTFLDKDYLTKYFWNDYTKTNRKFYKKFEEFFNLKSTLENESNSYTKLFYAGIITNEISTLLEEYYFISNLLLFLSNVGAQRMSQFFDIGIIIKNILSYITLSKGGVNFLTKNFEVTHQLLLLLDKITVNIQEENEKNFFRVSLYNTNNNNEILLNKSNNENSKYAKINEVLIQIGSKTNFTDEYILKLHFLQLKYLLQYSFMFLGCFDDLISLKEEENEFTDKSLDLLIIIHQNVKKSNLAKQALLSLVQNDFFFSELLVIIEHMSSNIDNIREYEGHINLLLQLFIIIFTDLDPNSDLVLLLNGSSVYTSLLTLKDNLQAAYEKKELEPINKNLFDNFDAVFGLLYQVHLYTSSKDIKCLMSCINDSCFNNLQKYNLNEKAIKVKEEKYKDYLDEYKLNIKKHSNNDVSFLERINMKGSLINDIFSAVKIVSLSVNKYIL